MNKIFALRALLLTITACTNPEKRVHQLLTERMETLAVAESCTGGSIAARLMATPGASAYFKGGVVAYWNQTKESLLGIPRDTIALCGVVSEEIVRKMAESVRNVTDTHYGIATTGIAGPSGGTPELPAGSVWIAVSSPIHTVARLVDINGRREQVLRQAGPAAIALLEEELLQEKSGQYAP